MLLRLPTLPVLPGSSVLLSRRQLPLPQQAEPKALGPRSTVTGKAVGQVMAFPTR